MRVVAIANQKGGVGKTTTCINLAACLTALDQRVLLIDLDPQANATSGLGVAKAQGESLYEVLLGEARIADCIRPTAYTDLHIIPSEVDLAGAEIDVARSDNYLHRVNDTLADLKRDNPYDFVFIDCPPSLGILTMNAMAAADGVLVPIQSEYYALEGLSVIVDLIEKIRRSGGNSRLRLEGIVMTMYDRRTNLSLQVAKEVRRHFAEHLFETIIPRTVRLSEAPSHGLPILDYDPEGAGARAYTKLAEEFLARERSFASEAPPAV